jgi:hypothetical protein
MKRELLGMLHENHDVKYSYEYFYGDCIIMEFTIDNEYRVVISKQGSLFKADISYLTDIGYIVRRSIEFDNVTGVAQEISDYIDAQM